MPDSLVLYDADLRRIAEECRDHVLRHPACGFTGADLATYCAAFRLLPAEDREWVQIAMVKMRELAVIIGRYGAAHFYGRNTAPDGAFNVEQARHAEPGEIIERAGRLG